MAHLKQALTIATSDSGGGAGIQADIKAIEANGAYALSVLVALTAQNTRTVTMIHALPREIIEAQIDAVFDDFEIDAVKTGMLYSADIVRMVSERLGPLQIQNLVVDPVMISKSGCELLKSNAIEEIKKSLFPLARIVTPNIHEAERLASCSIRTLEDAREAAQRIRELGCAHVLIKGGHLPEQPATDLLYDGTDFMLIEGEWIDTPNTHGTGCTYASAIAAHLAQGKLVTEAVVEAKHYITEAIRNSLSIGKGQGPTNHFYFLKNR